MRSRILSLIICLSAGITSWANAPKYIFYFIGDGMGLAPVMVAEAYNRTVLNNTQHLHVIIGHPSSVQETGIMNVSRPRFSQLSFTGRQAKNTAHHSPFSVFTRSA